MTLVGQNGPERFLIGRYALYGEIASGGMATVHFGQLLGPAGFSRTVAIKRLHAQYAKDPEFVSMFLDEARLAARIQHPNVVATLDVVALDGELFLVMEYIQGEALSRLFRTARKQGERLPPRIVASVMSGMLRGLHAAHEAKDERGEPLGIVHRDVSPQNVLVGVDGISRVLDFGVAKAAGRTQDTRGGQIKGKLSYMAPEQLRGYSVDRRTDVYASGVVLWEALTGRRMFDGDNEGSTLTLVLEGSVMPPSTFIPSLPAAVDDVVMRGLEHDPEKRFATAREMAIALEHALGVASPYEVGEWVQHIAVEALALRAERIKEIEHVISIPSSRVSMEMLVNSASGVSSSLPAHPAPPQSIPTTPTTLGLGPNHHNPLGSDASLADLGQSSSPSHTSFSAIRHDTDMQMPAFRPHRGRVMGVILATLLAVGMLIALVMRLNSPPSTTDVTAAHTEASQANSEPRAAFPGVVGLAISVSAHEAVSAAPSEHTGSEVPQSTVSSSTPVMNLPSVRLEPSLRAPSSAPILRTSKAPSTAAKASATVNPAKPLKESNCNPPFTIDADGHKHPKLECL